MDMTGPMKGFLKIHMLKLISEKPSSGYGLMNFIEEISGRRPSAGSIYPLLKDMEKRGLIEAQHKNKKTNYIITDKGKKALEELKERQKDFLESVSKSLSTYSIIFEDEVAKFVLEQMSFYRKFSELPFPDEIWGEFRRLRNNLFGLSHFIPIDDEITLRLKKILRNTNLEIERIKKSG
ncbi:MAG: hypothetical protein DRN17_00530 [Thermoplasmata archaeon]|nr:MAG: hypothetical protein DRN17_00530 [Thermoplasmata archaeon]RLF64239.1 MAG: hypothetical protein DRN31_00735 [Thermoplasmata archaeon]